MKRIACGVLAVAALLLIYFTNAAVAWAMLSAMFVLVWTKRRRSHSGAGATPRKSAVFGAG